MSLSLSNEKQKQTVGDVVRKILGGSEHVISHPGASQYTQPGGGASACGLAALNCARVVLGKEQHGMHDEALLQNIMSLETAEEIMSICTQWSTKAHLEVEDIHKVPIFAKHMRLVSTMYSRPGLKRFKKLLTELAENRTSAATIITRPPEIIACVKVAIRGKPLFLIFDSHPRPLHPTGAGFIFSTSVDYIAEHLNDLLALDRRLLTDRNMQWQAQLLANFSGHTFLSRNSPTNLTQVVLESSLTILALQAEVADLKYQNTSLAVNNKQLETRIEEKERDAEIQQQHRLLNLYGSPPSSSCHPSQSHPSPNSNLDRAIEYSRHNPGSSSYADVTARSLSYHAEGSYSTQSASVLYSRDKDHPEMTKLYLEGKTSEMIAVQKQREFEEEDRRLREERAALANAAPVIFTCRICFEQQLEDYVARVDNCNHALCRDCARNYIVSKLLEHRFPILCPVCVADAGHKEPEDALILQVGINDKQYELYVELQMASFGILIHCRQCKQSAFVDRQEYRDSLLIVCPLPKCQHAWCKACQQTIAIAGPKHSCDGSSELEHLMKQRGWKHCPGCQTPILKDSGCNHMTCMSPGCNAHFCYLCGKLIIRSGLAQAINAAISEHFRRCRLFEDVPDRAN